MTDRMAIVPIEATEEDLERLKKANPYAKTLNLYEIHAVTISVIAVSPNAGKVSPGQLKAAVDAMGGCDLPYLPRARREIFARATAKAWGLEIA